MRWSSKDFATLTAIPTTEMTMLDHTAPSINEKTNFVMRLVVTSMFACMITLKTPMSGRSPRVKKAMVEIIQRKIHMTINTLRSISVNPCDVT